MSIIQTQTTSFKAQLYQGIHDLTTDVIKIALYTANANLNEDTTVYSTTDEVAATGTYPTGGSQLTPITVSTSGYTAYVSFPNITWTAAITARCALIYNASKGNKSVAVLDFGSDKTSTTTFTVTMPVNGATTSLIRSSN
jgi:hypothetical protein